MPLPRVKLRLMSDHRENLVEVDGHDITRSVAGIQVSRSAGGVPVTQVTVHLNGEVELETDLAEVVVMTPAAPAGDPAESLREMLTQADPGELEQAALAKMGGLDGGPTTVGAAMIQVLQEWASD